MNWQTVIKQVEFKRNFKLGKISKKKTNCFLATTRCEQLLISWTDLVTAGGILNAKIAPLHLEKMVFGSKKIFSASLLANV